MKKLENINLRTILHIEVFSEENVKSVKPAYGFRLKYSKTNLGKKAKKDIKKETLLQI